MICRILLCCLLPWAAAAQPNCKAYLMEGDTLQYKACIVAERGSASHYQFSRPCHEACDQALAICPYFAYAYRKKSVSYLKSGDFINWKKLIDKAVQYDTLENLGNRGWCRYQFFRDYEGAIADIELLEKIKKGDIGYGVNGDYHLTITKAMCYSALGQKQKAIDIMEVKLADKRYEPFMYDYYQLGVTYFQTGNLEKAMTYFEKQHTKRPLAENTYYKSLIFKAKGDLTAAQTELTLARQMYELKKYMFDPYTHHFNKVYYETIMKGD
jgi:tetratricopeptide (TPR) repeat protein